MPFVQRVIEPKYLGRTSLFDEEGHPKVSDEELQASANSTLANALRQLASLVTIADDIFGELRLQLQDVVKRSDSVRLKITVLEEKVAQYDPKKVTVPEGDICSFAHRKTNYTAKHPMDTNLFSAATRPNALQALYENATKTPVHLMRQLDRWRRDGHRSSRFFLCTPVLGAKRRKIRNRIDIEIETRTPAAVEDLRRWTSIEALGDITVSTEFAHRIHPNITTTTDGDTTDGTLVSDDEAIDHKLPSPEEQLQVIALKFPAEIVAVDISGKSFDRMSVQRRSLMHGEAGANQQAIEGDPSSMRRRTRSRKPRNRRRNTLAGTDQKEIRDALTAGEEPTSPIFTLETDSGKNVLRSKSSDLLRSKKDSPDKKSHFNTLKQWGKSRYDRFMNKSSELKSSGDIDDFNLYETVTMKRKRDLDKERRTHERNSSISSSEKSSITLPNIAVKLRESSAQRRQRRTGSNKDEPHSSSGNWSASSESGRASIGSEITSTTHPKSTTSAGTSCNSLNQPGSVNSRRRFINTSAPGSVTSEGTLTPDIIHDLHEDETCSVYSCDTEGYYTSFHLDSGLKTLKEEELPSTPLHTTSAFSNSSSNNTVLSAENEYELFGKGSTSTTTSSAGTVCTTLRAGDSSRSLIIGPAVPERKSSLSKLSVKGQSPESSLERDFSDKTGTVKRSPATKGTIVVEVHSDKGVNGDVSPDSGHNTSSSPIESINSPHGVRSNSDFEFSESSDMEGPERIERIRVKTTINSSRIPSMCVITPPQSDDESVKSVKNTERKNVLNRKPMELPLKNSGVGSVEPKSSDSDKENVSLHSRIISTIVNGTNKFSLINVNPLSGYATVHPIDHIDGSKSLRAPSPSGGTVTVKSEQKSPQQPIYKSPLLPLNTMLGKLKSNIANFAERRKSKSPLRPTHPEEIPRPTPEEPFDAGEYVTIADVRNNNKTQTYVNDPVTSLLTNSNLQSEYVSLNELPQNEPCSPSIDSLERKRRQGARVMLDAEGKVVYSSDSLRRRKGCHTTFEPGPFVKPVTQDSPQAVHRTVKTPRPVTQQTNRFAAISPVEFNRPINNKVVIKAAASGSTSPTTELVRMPPATIVSAPSPKHRPGGAYVHVQDAHDKDRVPNYPVSSCSPIGSPKDMYQQFRGDQAKQYLPKEYYLRNQMPSSDFYSTLPNRKTQFFQNDPERSVTPDITRGLGRVNYDSSSMDRRAYQQNQAARQFYRSDQLGDHNLGIPVQIPQVVPYGTTSTPIKRYQQTDQTFRPITEETFKISPIDPRNSGSFQASTPQHQDLKAAVNLEQKLLSPKKSTMSNEELYAIIHKSKKKMNISDEKPNVNTASQEQTNQKPAIKSPETGYLGDKARSRSSWSPNKAGEYIDFNAGIDKISPPTNESRTRQSWACTDRKPPQQTSRLDFKRLLLQKSNFLSPSSKKLSAVEQLKISKQQISPASPSKTPPPNPNTSQINILELSGSPRSLINRKFQNQPTTPEKKPPAPPSKILSPRSQWRFANPRTDVLSSTILEDCREDENSPNTSGEKPEPTISQRIQAQRAQFFNSAPTAQTPTQIDITKACIINNTPTLETAF